MVHLGCTLTRPTAPTLFRIPEEEAAKFLALRRFPFRLGENASSEEWTEWPSIPERFLEYLSQPAHLVVFGSPGSGKTWLSHTLENILGVEGNVQHYRSPLVYRTLHQDVRDWVYHHASRGSSCYVMISEVEELLQGNQDIDSAWAFLLPLFSDVALFRHSDVFFKLILPERLRSYVEAALPTTGTAIGTITLEWSDEDLLRLLHRRLGVLERADASLASLVGDDEIKGGFVAYDSNGRPCDLDHYLVSLAKGSPRCLVALGRHLLVQAAARCAHAHQESCKVSYKDLAHLLEAYYGSRADPIWECQGLCQKPAGK